MASPRTVILYERLPAKMWKLYIIFILKMHKKVVQQRSCTEPKSSPDEGVEFAFTMEAVSRDKLHMEARRAKQAQNKNRTNCCMPISTGRV